MKHTIPAILAGLLTSSAAIAQDAPFQLSDITFFTNATTTEDERTGYSVDILKEEDLQDAGDLQLTEVLARLPGVSITQNGGMGSFADIRIRGARGRYIGVYIDGILVTDPSGTVIAYEDFGGLTTGSIRRIEVLRGSQSALYGGTAVGGVINISTLAGEAAPDGTTQNFSLEAGSYNTVALSYGLTQRTGRLALDLGIDRTQSDGFSAAEEDAGNTEDDAFSRSRLSFGAAYDATDTVTFGINGFVEQGSQEFDEGFFVPFDGTPNEFSDRETFGLRAFTEIDTGTWQHEAALSYYRIERTSFTDPGSGFDVFEGRRIAFDYVGSTDMNELLDLSFGLNAMREEAFYSNLAGGEATVDTVGGFVEANWAASSDLDISGTLRYDDHSGFGGQTTGRLAFAWRPNDQTIIRGAIGTGYRAPSLDELYGTYPDPLYPYQGNPNLLPEESMSVELGFDRSFANGASLSATVFLLEVENLVTFDPCPTTGVSPFPCLPATLSTLQNVPGTSARQGLELAGSILISDAVTLIGNYTYTEAEAANGTPLNLVPRHEVVLGLDAELTDRLDLAVNAQRVIGAFDGGTPLDDYTLVNSSVAFDVTENVEAYLRIENLFDEQYQTRRGYGTSDRAFFIGLRANF